MRPTALAFDLSRLIARLRHASPSGIDRVDLAYARHALSREGACFGVVATPLGPRLFERDAMRALVDAVTAAWVEDAPVETDPVYRGLALALGGAAVEAPAAAGRPGGRRRLQAAFLARALRGPPARALPRGAVYVNTSHMGLERPERFDWLYGRPDLRRVFLVHDLIPITHPEYGRPGEAERHARRIATVGRHATQVLVDSADAGARLAAHWARTGTRACPITVVPLGVEPAFAEPGPALPVREPTFLVCGTIESRKNHLMLLQVWRGLIEACAARGGGRPPRLLVVGRRGWEAEAVFDLLDRCARLRPHVSEVAGLSTPGLARLMRGATALLMPSFTEGYGLPVVEAAACGLPVVASDIAVHREIAGDHALFLDPLDGRGWAEAVTALGAPGSRLRADLAARLTGRAGPTWAGYFARVEATLAGLPDG